MKHRAEETRGPVNVRCWGNVVTLQKPPRCSSHKILVLLSLLLVASPWKRPCGRDGAEPMAGVGYVRDRSDPSPSPFFLPDKRHGGNNHHSDHLPNSPCLSRRSELLCCNATLFSCKDFEVRIPSCREAQEVFA